MDGAGNAFGGGHGIVEGLIDGGEGLGVLGGGLGVAEGIDEALDVA